MAESKSAALPLGYTPPDSPFLGAFERLCNSFARDAFAWTPGIPSKT
jgi:hypothetical protein